MAARVAAKRRTAEALRAAHARSAAATFHDGPELARLAAVWRAAAQDILRAVVRHHRVRGSLWRPVCVCVCLGRRWGGRLLRGVIYQRDGRGLLALPVRAVGGRQVRLTHPCLPFSPRGQERGVCVNVGTILDQQQIPHATVGYDAADDDFVD